MLPDDPNQPLPVEPISSDSTSPVDPYAPPPVGYVAGPAPVVIAGRRPVRRGLVLGVALVLIAFLGGGALFVSGYSLGNRQVLEPGTPATEEAQFKAFWDSYHAVRDRYALGPVDTKTLVEGAIKGMVESIGDPYSSYLSPEDYQASLQEVSGQFEGIGVEPGTVDSKGKTVDCNVYGPECRFVIVAPLSGSPAEAAGIKAGDIVVSVDGATLDGLSPDQARDRIRGKAGTSVTLRIERAGAAAFDVTVVRAKIQREELVARDLANGSVGYLKLANFSEAGADAFVTAIKKDVDSGKKKIIVDLRGNPGGYIDAAQRVASAFIASGPVYWQEDVHGVQTETDAVANGAATDPSIKVILLIDKGSASASEIVAGALQDTHRATLVGETSFGKGTVQQWLPIDDGAVKLTIAKWLTPNKRWIHKIGIVPDVPVTVPTTLPAGSDPVLDKALSIFGAAALGPVLQLAA
jgi:carboxyl-terminal processing protease